MIKKFALAITVLGTAACTAIYSTTAVDLSSGYQYDVHPAAAQAYPVRDVVPFGVVFELSGTPTGVYPGDSNEAPTVSFSIDGYQAETIVRATDTLLTVAARIEKSFESQGVSCVVLDSGATIVCESVSGRQVDHCGGGSYDEGIAFGFDFLKF